MSGVLRRPQFIASFTPSGELVHVRLKKGWWGGPGTGVKSVLLEEFDMEIPVGDDREKIAQVLYELAIRVTRNLDRD